MSTSVIEARGDILHAFFSDARRALGWRLPALIVLMTVVGFSEGLTLALLLPLLTRVGIAGTNDSIAATAINQMIEIVAPGPAVYGIVVIILFIALLQMALFLGQAWWTARLVCRHAAVWQIRLFEKFLAADWLFLTERKSGELVNAIIVEAWRNASAFQYFTYLCSAALAAAIYLGFALLVSWQTTLLMVALAVVMVLSISRLYRISDAVGRQTGPLNAELQVLVGESLASVKIIKTTVSEQRMVDRAVAVVRSLERLGRVAMFLPNFVRGVFEFMALAAMASFLAFGISALGVAPADMVVVLALFVRLFPRFINAQTLLHQFNTYVPAIVALRRILGDTNARLERTGGADDNFNVVLPTRLEIHGLKAGYGDAAVINGADLTLEIPGMIGVVGGSGAGKSTLVHVLLGLVAPSAGSIRLGALDMNDIALRAWRRVIGYVPQETMFFHASVADNIVLARPDATRNEIIDAARRANAHEFIMALPQGYDTPIGDQGVLLSGGQRQRLGIARALIARPLILLLDEPTSALDPESELEVMATLEDLRKSVGILIVAHRLTTVRSADLIYVLDQGRVAEAGNWVELIARRERFHALARLQQIVA